MHVVRNQSNVHAVTTLMFAVQLVKKLQIHLKFFFFSLAVELDLSLFSHECIEFLIYLTHSLDLSRDTLCAMTSQCRKYCVKNNDDDTRK